jgi:hypothetical protein
MKETKRGFSGPLAVDSPFCSVASMGSLIGSDGAGPG